MNSASAVERSALAPERAIRSDETRSGQNRAPSDRRGPFRPGQLVSARAKMNGQSIARLFRFTDLLIVAVMAWIACVAAAPRGLLAAPLGEVLPFAFGGLAVSWGLEASGAYEFRPRELLSAHLLRAAA